MSSDMNDMSNQPISADDWAPATLGNVNISTVTFTVDGTDDTVTAEFPSAMEAFDFVGRTGPKFEYSAIEGAIRDQNGTVVPLPEPPAERIPCGLDQCDLVADGHKGHWIPVLRAANGPKEDWLPITIIEHDGNKLIFSTKTACTPATTTTRSALPTRLTTTASGPCCAAHLTAAATR